MDIFDFVHAALVRSLEYSARFVLASSLVSALTVPSVLNSIGRSKWGRYCAVVVVVVTFNGASESVACAQSA